MLPLFAITLFVSATLLFLIQPMIAKMILPLLGGTPAVWNTCMVFFQALLLAGYAYAHAAPARLDLRRQTMLHAAVLLLPLLALPIAVGGGWEPPTEANPLLWLLGLLLVTAGLPFFVVSTSAPLLQRWFSGTGHRAAKDPYFLYSASNLGSMLALLGYPVLVEPHLRLEQQSWLWAAGYVLLITLTGACAVLTWRASRSPARAAASSAGPDAASGRSGASAPVGLGTAVVAPGGSTGRPDLRQRLRWTVLAFVPSSLLLGVTTFLTTDIAAIPLLWVVPLALYLLTFILAFANTLPGLRDDLRVWLPVLVLWLVFAILARVNVQARIAIPLHLGTFFLAALTCHGALAASRPSSRYLTDFYLCMSLGGVLGGLFNTFIAPQVFSSVAEYPLAMVLALLFVPVAARRSAPASARRSVDVAVFLGFLFVSSAVVLLSPGRDLQPAWVGRVLTYGALLALCLPFIQRPARFASAVAAVLLAATFFGGRQDYLLHQERTFFGVVRVVSDPVGGYHRMIHGSTLHGMQSLDPRRRGEPLTYFHRTGPIGQVFASLRGTRAKERVAILGLGTGSLAAYGAPGQAFTFYEIDPAIERVASEPRYFTFLQDSRADVRVVLGDARLRLEDAPDSGFGLIVGDAFSSDAVPMHLVTREAIDLYLQKLEPGGLMAFNISNRYLDLEPVFAALAADADLVGLAQENAADDSLGKAGSEWVVLARTEADLGPLVEDRRWNRLDPAPAAAVWTDDFSNMLSAVSWSKASGGVAEAKGSSVR